MAGCTSASGSRRMEHPSLEHRLVVVPARRAAEALSACTNTVPCRRTRRSSAAADGSCHFATTIVREHIGARVHTVGAPDAIDLTSEPRNSATIAMTTTSVPSVRRPHERYYHVESFTRSGTAHLSPSPRAAHGKPHRFPPPRTPSSESRRGTPLATAFSASAAPGSSDPPRASAINVPKSSRRSPPRLEDRGALHRPPPDSCDDVHNLAARRRRSGSSARSNRPIGADRRGGKSAYAPCLPRNRSAREHRSRSLAAPQRARFLSNAGARRMPLRAA